MLRLMSADESERPNDLTHLPQGASPGDYVVSVSVTARKP
jgi:hypothetical protein